MAHSGLLRDVIRLDRKTDFYLAGMPVIVDNRVPNPPGWVVINPKLFQPSLQVDLPLWKADEETQA